MVRLPCECAILARELGLAEPPCERCVAERFFSYWRGGKGEPKVPAGCWVAHTVLTALECARMRARLEKAVRRIGLKWADVEKLAVLHDVGKLSGAYARYGFRGLRHNVLSAVVAYHACGGNTAIVRAAFLHHEAFHWRDLYRLGVYQHLSDSLSSEVKQLVGRGFRLRDGYVLALENLADLLNYMEMRSVRPVLAAIAKESFYQMEPSELERKLGRFRPVEMALYWILYLADNRAASARETSRAYWLDAIGRLPEEAKGPAELADRILGLRGRLAHISLTALPNLRGGEGREWSSPRSG